MKQAVLTYLDTLAPAMTALADDIFDHPECSGEETYACGLLCSYLEQQGFTVQRGLGRLPTAFRAQCQLGSGQGPRIGLLCEYDALEGKGHACGHHMQGAAIVGAAVALKENCPFDGTLVVYGTPAEEKGGGKILLLEDGYLRDIDVALMMHGAPMTCVDVRSMAGASLKVTFHGTSAHAALKPEAGRSALDALLLTFQGVEFLREHVLEDTRMHYTVAELPGPANVVPDRAVGSFSLRSYNTSYLQKQLIPRFEKLVQGAALMTETTGECVQQRLLQGKIPVGKLNDLMMENAKLVDAPNRQPPREKTGSSDFGNVMYCLPGCCIRVAFVPEGTPSHSQCFVDMGKSRQAHEAILTGAKIVAGTAWDLLEDPGKLEEIWEEFRANKAAQERNL